jgi:hypothetical protein
LIMPRTRRAERHIEFRMVQAVLVRTVTRPDGKSYQPLARWNRSPTWPDSSRNTPTLAQRPMNLGPARRRSVYAGDRGAGVPEGPGHSRYRKAPVFPDIEPFLRGRVVRMACAGVSM